MPKIACPDGTLKFNSTNPFLLFLCKQRKHVFPILFHKLILNKYAVEKSPLPLPGHKHARARWRRERLRISHIMMFGMFYGESVTNARHVTRRSCGESDSSRVVCFLLHAFFVWAIFISILGLAAPQVQFSQHCCSEARGSVCVCAFLVAWFAGNSGMVIVKPHTGLCCASREKAVLPQGRLYLYANFCSSLFALL